MGIGDIVSICDEFFNFFIWLGCVGVGFVSDCFGGWNDLNGFFGWIGVNYLFLDEICVGWKFVVY